MHFSSLPYARAALNVRIDNDGKIHNNLDIDQEGSQDWLPQALAV